MTWKRLQRKGQTPFTTAVSLVYGLEVALAMMEQEGWDFEKTYANILLLMHRAAVKALGFSVLPEHPVNGVTVIVCPEGLDANKIVRVMDDEFGVRVAGGQAHLSGQVFRIGHTGGIRERDLAMVIGALERALAAIGHASTPGTGLAALQQALLEP